MSLLLSRFKQFRLGIFGKKTVKIKLEAADPDDACYVAFKMFCDTIMKQDDSVETKMLLKDAKYDFRILKLK